VKDSFRNLMLNVQRLTRSGRLGEATAAIQRALGGGNARAAAEQATQAAQAARAAEPPRGFEPNAFDAEVMQAEVIDVEARVIDELQPDAPLTDFAESIPPDVFMPPPAAPAARPTPEVTIPAGGEFIAATYSCAAGSRAYKLYRPSGQRTALLPLVVMLHGCKQNPDDFAAGTRMNQLAEQNGWLVLYPAQSREVNQMGCWNWFKAEDQQRDRGEPAIIAEMTRHIVRTCGADPKRVYVAGLSAGGAMADIMATTYPDLYAAAGIHSGLAHAAAHDLMSALNAMRQGPRPRSGLVSPSRSGLAPPSRSGPAAPSREPVPTIVFHGDSDATVHPSNGDHVVAQARSAGAAGAAAPGVRVEQGEVAGGRRYTRTIQRDAQGRSSTEHWVVHGAGHAWSGGHPSGSYTDPLGPDASAQMLRFFAEHPKAA
jgi:poly(hydroxyalkanoate) depolymerase family esterase